jgi:hypothetical protein
VAPSIIIENAKKRMLCQLQVIDSGKRKRLENNIKLTAKQMSNDGINGK